MKIKTAVPILTLLALVLAYSGFVLAEQNQPTGAQTINYISSSSSNTSLYPPSSIGAEAGNLTYLTISGETQTKSWQGYYGNISGTIVLEDALGYRFYEWAAAEPQGEIYASVYNNITWTDVSCAPIGTGGYLTPWNTYYSINDTDYDAINETFSLTDHPTFYTGTTTLTGCPTTYTFTNNATQGVDFPAVLLSTDGNTSLIFTSIIENKSEGIRTGIEGFDGGNYDFQMLVAEDGSNGNDVVTPYYFWVEIQ